MTDPTIKQTQFAKENNILCPLCQRYSQVWINQRTGLWTCHRLICANYEIPVPPKFSPSNLAVDFSTPPTERNYDDNGSPSN